MSVLALDIGGTTLKAALVDAEGRSDLRSSAPTRRGDDVVADAAALLAGLRDQAPASDPPQAVGVVTAGTVDGDAGTVRHAANLGWRDLPLAALLAERLGLPVGLDHDVRAGAAAELQAGEAQGDMLFVALGTGVGAGVITGGRAQAGAAGAAGELGHMIVRPGGPLCACGQRGCLEALFSAEGLRRRLAEAGRAEVPDLAVLPHHPDPVSVAIWRDGVQALALALHNATMLLDPARIVLGGGLSGWGETLLRPLRADLAAGLAWRSPPELALAHHGPEAGLHGAALLARNQLADTPLADVAHGGTARRPAAKP
ncbi:ROK family protein [Nesterenkonia aethiopica]|uniref:ROK family protein n=1 Tax=Nesterenkonia aethiopica TaxID=269144 RepID=A0ABP6M477_9MICC